MREYVTFFIGAVIFFIVGVWAVYLDILFQDVFTDNETTGRGFWTTISLSAIAIAVILLVHYLIVEPKNGTEASGQFINIHAHKSKALKIEGDVDIGDVLITR